MEINLHIYRAHIYCPYCGARIFPEIPGGTDGMLDGQWICVKCGKEFVLDEVRRT